MIHNKIRIANYMSGRHSWTRPFRKMCQDHEYLERASDPKWNVEIFSMDFDKKYAHDTTLIQDFETLTPAQVEEALGGPPDVIFCGFDCRTFSTASFGHHWGGGFRAFIPKTEAAKKALRMLDVLKVHMKAFPNAFVFVENPRAGMRKMKQMVPIEEGGNVERQTLWYCQYGLAAHGHLLAKPTDIFGRFPPSWKARPLCKNHTYVGPKEARVRTSTHCEHESGNRGLKNSGLQGIKGAKFRSLMPVELPEEIARCLMAHWEKEGLL